jgi:hypothetical protein
MIAAIHPISASGTCANPSFVEPRREFQFARVGNSNWTDLNACFLPFVLRTSAAFDVSDTWARGFNQPVLFHVDCRYIKLTDRTRLSQSPAVR